MVTKDDRPTTPRVRYDTVALRLVNGVRDALDGAVPDGRCAIFAVTAPLREPSRTMAVLIEVIRTRLSLRIPVPDYAGTLHGNQVRVRVMTSRSPHGANIVGFVHNPEPPPDHLLDLAQSALERGETLDWRRPARAS